MRSLLSSEEGYAGFGEDKGQGLLSDSHTPTSYYQSKRHLKLLAIVMFVVCVGLVPMLVWPTQTTVTMSARDDSSLKAVPDALIETPVMEETMVEEMPTKAVAKNKMKKTKVPMEKPNIGTKELKVEHENKHVVEEVHGTEAVHEEEHGTEVAHEEVQNHHLPYPAECAKEVKELKDGEHLVLEHISQLCHDAYKKMLLHATTAPVEEVIHEEGEHQVIDAGELEIKLQKMQAEMDRLRQQLAQDEAVFVTKPIDP
ncbi:hypothetical protein THRCLA_04953 [Thraustotheca clavata]|uniref:Transmembrane protein n=1 Tax=Thraustotheca clavata TaxID=74557 RepID=A0A1V9ZXJ0_9STRA|nr:hypothetical protein THRCLA_04953 [Thraustotheca clavata]